MVKITEIEIDRRGCSWEEFETRTNQELDEIHSHGLKVRTAFMNKEKTQLILECEEVNDSCNQKICIITGDDHAKIRFSTMMKSNELYNNKIQTNSTTSRGNGEPVVIVYEV